MCGDEGKKTSVKLDEIVIYWERYNAICTLPQNDDEQRVWTICREFWENNKVPLSIENYDVKDLDAAYCELPVIFPPKEKRAK